MGETIRCVMQSMSNEVELTKRCKEILSLVEQQRNEQRLGLVDDKYYVPTPDEPQVEICKNVFTANGLEIRCPSGAKIN